MNVRLNVCSLVVLFSFVALLIVQSCQSAVLHSETAISAEADISVSGEGILAPDELTPPSTNLKPAHILPSQLRSRPDIVVKAYAAAYPDIFVSVFEQDGDWVLETGGGKLFYWAHGRFLSPEKRNNWADYSPYQIYPYTGMPRNPAQYTPERVEALRIAGTPQERGKAQKAQEVTFLDTLFGVKNRATTEERLKKTTLFGKRVNVNSALLPSLARVDAAVAELAKTDEETASFLAKIVEVGGYSWRTVSGTARRSNHSYGLALDILPVNWQNKRMYWQWIRDFNPDWMLVPQDDLWMPPAAVVRIFEENGFIWGGTWDLYDTMHFEYRPELLEIRRSLVY